MVRERWLEENVPMPGAFAAEFIDNCYQHDRLMDGGWELDGEPVDLRSVTSPTLVVACERDFITPKEAALPLAEAVGAEHVRAEVLPTGHIGVVVGSMGPRVFYPLVDRWVREVS
jgi:polyhydroxyalkanoate synthase